MSIKLKKIDTLENEVNFLRSEKKTIGFANGCFDIIHKGHLKLLSESKEYCDFLIIGLNSDSSIRKLKGASRPVDNINTRIKNLSLLPVVDSIIVFSSDNPLELIKKIKPNFLFKGSDYHNKTIIGADEVIKNDGKAILINILDGFSTTSIINNKKNNNHV